MKMLTYKLVILLAMLATIFIAVGCKSSDQKFVSDASLASQLEMLEKGDLVQRNDDSSWVRVQSTDREYSYSGKVTHFYYKVSGNKYIMSYIPEENHFFKTVVKHNDRVNIARIIDELATKGKVIF